MSLQAKELFYDDWTHLNEKQAWTILYHTEQYKKDQSGYSLKTVLKTALRPNFKSTYKQLTAAQLRDIYHDPQMIWHHPFLHFFTTHFKSNGRMMVAPDERMGDITFQNFYYADAAYSKVGILHHSQQDAEEAINTFIATLYLPHNGTKRVAFDKEEVLRYANDIPLLPYQKNMILRSYGHIKNYIVNQRCPLVFDIPEEVEAEAIIPQHTGKMWLNIHYNIAESEAFRGFKTTADAGLYEVLDYLQYKKETTPTSA